MRRAMDLSPWCSAPMVHLRSHRWCAGSHRPLGIDGWRVAFLTVAALSALAGMLNIAFTRDPRRLPAADQQGQGQGQQQPGQGGGSSGTGQYHHQRASKGALWKEVLSIVRIPTFIIIVLQASPAAGSIGCEVEDWDKGCIDA
jgi:hypothetical protein